MATVDCPSLLRRLRVRAWFTRVRSGDVEIVVTVKDHQFDPAEIEAPANRPIVVRIRNLDPTPMEFESNALRVEKVMTGNSEAVVNIRAQKPGRYEFLTISTRARPRACSWSSAGQPCWQH